MIFCVFLFSFTVVFSQPYESCTKDEVEGCDENWTEGYKFIPVNDYDTCKVFVSYRYKKCVNGSDCFLIAMIDTIAIPQNSTCTKMLLERYYAGPIPYTNPDWNYLALLWKDMQDKVFDFLVDDVVRTCPDSGNCPSPTPKKHIMSVQSACMRWCTAKTSFSAPPDYINRIGGSLATIQQIARCNEVCCVQEIWYIKGSDCKYTEVNRTYKLKNTNGTVIGSGDKFECPWNGFAYPCFWDNNFWYIDGTSSNCLINCGPSK